MKTLSKLPPKRQKDRFSIATILRTVAHVQYDSLPVGRSFFSDVPQRARASAELYARTVSLLLPLYFRLRLQNTCSLHVQRSSNAPPLCLGSLWYEAGKGAKEFADTLGLATETAGDVEGATHLLAQVSMGPEFVFEVVEATKDRCVGKTTQCPWHKRWKEQGLDINTCGVGHQRWGDGAAESLNPDFTFRLTKNMLLGDPHCEWVVERKKK